MKYDFALMEFKPISKNYSRVYEMFLKLVVEREYCLSVSKISHIKELGPTFIGLNVRANTVDKLYSELEPLLEDRCWGIGDAKRLAKISYYVD